VHPVGENKEHVLGRVLSARFLGDLVLLGVAVQGLSEPIASLVRGDRAPAVGSDIGLAIDPAGTMIFADT